MTSESPAQAPSSDRDHPIADSSAQDILISVRNVSKSYLVYKESIDRLKQAFWGRHKTYHHTVHSLRNISFDLRRGRSLGIIGRNGSGKSTLLQLIAGTLSPTEGEVHTFGRIAALLELGSGFNPDFTGRENVFLSGVIMGLTRAQMEEHYQEIVDFADIGEFIDMPVKTYSSGMMVRLAFATSINVNADVLIIDEALAVGDASFQEKCFARLKKMIQAGTTLLFVSHDTETVSQLCSDALLLEKGEMHYFGEPKEAISRYFQLWASMKTLETIVEESGQSGHPAEQEEQPKPEGADEPDAIVKDSGRGENHPLRKKLDGLFANNTYCAFEQKGRWGNRELELIGLYVLDQAGRYVEQIEFGRELTLLIRARANQDVGLVDIGFHVQDLKSLPLIAATNFNMPARVGPVHAGQEVMVEFKFPARLRSGPYFIVIGLGAHPPGAAYYDWLPQARTIEVVDTSPFQASGWGMTMPTFKFDSALYKTI
jgi:lipopolysaccharide transport system ATP-binding protein